MIISIVINYFFGILIDRSNEQRGRLVTTIGVTFNVLLLVYYKYFWFITQNLNAAFGWNVGTVYPIPLPIGISFYTFHSLSYLIDVHRKKVKAQTNVLDLGLYISFFPQLIAGPIIRYVDVSEQIEKRSVQWNGFATGVQRFIIGLAKKVLIANTLGEVADKIFGVSVNEITVMTSWLGIICYSFQIYFDFSGYSDMALGLGRMFGFTFKENFNHPYSATSVKDFWRRWHISLSTWFRDYVYIPLGGNRGSAFRTHVNLIAVFFITGLWHGASWNFVIWGLFHGFFLILEKGTFGVRLERSWRPLQHFYTLLVVLVGWVFFRLETFSGALHYLAAMVGLVHQVDYPFFVKDFFNQKIIICLAVAILSSTSFTFGSSDKSGKILALRRTVTAIFLIFIFLLSIASIASDTYNPFIYFRF